MHMESGSVIALLPTSEKVSKKNPYIILKYMKNLSLSPQRATVYGKG